MYNQGLFSYQPIKQYPDNYSVFNTSPYDSQPLNSMMQQQPYSGFMDTQGMQNEIQNFNNDPNLSYSGFIDQQSMYNNLPQMQTQSPQYIADQTRRYENDQMMGQKREQWDFAGNKAWTDQHSPQTSMHIPQGNINAMPELGRSRNMRNKNMQNFYAGRR